MNPRILFAMAEDYTNPRIALMARLSGILGIRWTLSPRLAAKDAGVWLGQRRAGWLRVGDRIGYGGELRLLRR